MNTFNSFHSRPIGAIHFCLTFGCLLWFGVIVLRASDRYVVEPGTGGTNEGPYTDWSIAATQIQWAVDAATNANDTVWVSNGTYVLTNQIVVISNIVLRSTNGSDVTIVNGGFVAGAPDATTNNRCLYLSNASAFVSGFTFSNGACTNMGGGGVWVGNGILSNCTVRNNTNAGGSGGGVLLKPGGTIVACRITDNNGSDGAGIRAHQNTLSCVISNCLISNNVSYGASGGISAYGSVQIKQSMICNNRASTSAGSAGGLSMTYVTLDSCTVTVNQAAYGGGCWFVSGTITNCVISLNKSFHASYGGGIHLRPDADGPCKIRNSTISGNTNGGVWMDGKQWGSWMTDCTITNNESNSVYLLDGFTVSNCVIRDNKGTVRCRDGMIRNCIIAGNSNNGTGGGLWIDSASRTALVSSCTIASNWSKFTGAGLRFEATNVNQLSVSSCIIYSNGVNGTDDVYDARAPTNYNALQYSCIGTNPGFTGAVIIVADPVFKDPAGGNYRLSGSSPCVNRGSNETWMTNACDLDNNRRIRYGTVDMGAYERINEGTIYSAH